ncbi:MAG: nickel pincer cofactor biosynthesis protein LarC, partial [Lachnospiraceae bacterium]|nr:nickel pincer cofactor biosynthesis protein LarC [Lachnospiraceae bacterium]
MKRTLYLECYSGISGDMTVAALLDLGADRKALDEAVDSIRPLVSGFDVEIKRVQKAGIDACDFAVLLDAAHENHDHDMEYLHGHGGAHSHGHEHEYAHSHGHEHEHEHSHGHEHEHEERHEHAHSHGHEHEHEERHEHAHSHEYEYAHSHVHEGEQGSAHKEECHHHKEAGHHHHTGMAEITAVLNQAKLTDGARTLALNIFDILARAESKAHNKPISEVHFHEVGAVDSIVDIMAAAVCLDSLKDIYQITDVVVSELYEGHGSVRCQHGILPVPVPATANIVQAHGLPMHFMEQQGEFVTPTGAAIAAAVRTAGNLPRKFTVVAQGVGAGKRNYEKASILRAMIVEECSKAQDVIYKLESNIDDCPGEAFGYVMDRLFEAGARDVYYTPVFMKKNRPSYQLNVICDAGDIPKLEQIIFQETTTIGIRRAEMARTVLRREKQTRNTAYGMLEVKVCGDRVYPEYEALLAVCRERG